MHDGQTPPPLDADDSVPLTAAPASPAQTDPGGTRPSLHQLQLRPLGWEAPGRWLRLGWQDWCRCPGFGLFYGACYVAIGWLALTLFEYAPAFILALLPVFLLLGPVLMLGLYYASMRLERGLRPDLGRSLHAWDIHPQPLGWLALLLLAVALLWVVASLLVFTLLLETPQALVAPLGELLDHQQPRFAIAYLASALGFGAVVFALGVVSIPLALDRGTDALQAITLSLRLIRTRPGVMLLWAALIGLLGVLAILPAFMGLLVIAPVLGHASWHAYRACVEDAAPIFVIEMEPDPEEPQEAPAPCCSGLMVSEEVLDRVDTSHLNTI